MEDAILTYARKSNNKKLEKKSKFSKKQTEVIRCIDSFPENKMSKIKKDKKGNYLKIASEINDLLIIMEENYFELYHEVIDLMFEVLISSRNVRGYVFNLLNYQYGTKYEAKITVEEKEYFSVKVACLVTNDDYYVFHNIVKQAVDIGYKYFIYIMITKKPKEIIKAM